ncbi:type III-B CRISPR-associated protein Cas10/Cmr2 [Haliangium sp. UPWRP_2]|uniref:type III-B CRISPR-associated protein Cas10/Cmr2 n=1 Tax=Haliangium sp. UPWRP_2 TaxID=1931276 RepID=UPI000B547C4A|nr:type III-B CRISPR-associated protein Cas10/Cmr2 [Haliangium sp. UPWRP_2]PSM32299.1 type III-B CRISPR-associated protein Cas10/Cmr2 [Haliangium sp. UPWRP_2]
MTEHLLIVSLGPVQEFIAAARRCQDLWFGSYLLSELSLATACGLQAAGESGKAPELIFPGGLLNDKSGVANKLVAWLPAGLAPEAAVDRGRKKMQERLAELRDQSFNRCEELYKQDFVQNRVMAVKQIDDLMELQWVSIPLGSGGYAEAHARAEQLLSWRKNTRSFEAVPWKSKVGIPKSSIDGQRESVINEDFFDRVKNTTRLGGKYQLALNERLCGVGLLKRFGKQMLEDEVEKSPAEPAPPRLHRPIFHSNSHVAAGPLLTRFWNYEQQGQGTQQAFARYVSKLRDLGLNLESFQVRCEPGAEQRVFPRGNELREGYGFDGYLLYEDRLPSMFEEESTVPIGELKKTVPEAQAALRTFLKVLAPANPPLYYAILSADGDRMGQAITELAKRSDGKGQHQQLSEALARFAGSVRSIVESEQHGGSLIYSGGDDVLALLPLHTALSCSNALQTAFIVAVSKVTEGLSIPPTLSVGLAVVHHLDHMSTARARAREAEKLAKRTRNALAILVDKRSGGLLTVSRPWDSRNKKGEVCPLNARIDQWCKLLKAEILPDGVAYELEALLEPFELQVRLPGASAKSTAPAAVIDALVRRTLSRKPGAQLAGVLNPDIDELLYTEAELQLDPIGVVKSLSAEIQIAREFQKAYELARGGQP